MIELIMLSELYFAFITVVPQKLLFRERDYFPDVVCDYRAPDSCNPNNPPLPCCQRPKVLGDTTSTNTTAMQWCHGCERSTFDGSNEPCHFAAVNFASTV